MPEADPDHDSLNNLLEYATGGNPKLASDPPLKTESATATEITVLYDRNSAASDVTLAFEHSTTLASGSWSPVTPATDTLVSTSGTTEHRKATFSRSSSPTVDFFRLRVTAP